jgi:hypothetical protein
MALARTFGPHQNLLDAAAWRDRTFRRIVLHAIMVLELCGKKCSFVLLLGAPLLLLDTCAGAINSHSVKSIEE